LSGSKEFDLHCHSGNCLIIDLTAHQARSQALPESLLKTCIGGSALGTRLLLEWSTAGTDPLTPGNPLVFACGALAGTLAPASSGHVVVTKSPLTGLLAETLSFGRFSLALRHAGYDAVVITGISPSPVYLIIDDDRVHFIKADYLKGKGTFETAAYIRRTMGDLDVEVACIGLAGEQRVRYASVSDGCHLSKRGGAGAVMGSKNLKAIAVRGTHPVSVADLPALEDFCLRFYARCRSAATIQDHLDPAECLLALDRAHALPTRNFQQSSFEAAATLSQTLSGENRPVKRTACPTCPVACGHVYTIASQAVILDYQALVSLGPLCGIASPPAILEAAGLCQSHGLDPVSCGGSIAWAMESFGKGVMGKEEPASADVRFGDDTALINTVKAIAHRTGLGDLLAEGTRTASARIGHGSEQWAMNVKGLEIPPCDPRLAKSEALETALGLVDQSFNCCRPDSSGTALDQGLDDDLAAALDSLTLCRSVEPCFQDLPQEASQLYSICTGTPTDPAELRQAGQRAIALKRAFNIREGWQRSHDSLPARLFSGDLTEEGLKAATDDYYRSRGWSAAGAVPATIFEDLGIEDALEFTRGDWIGHGHQL
jgi:aldehyde:ferredoxin oxidoreductase